MWRGVRELRFLYIILIAAGLFLSSGLEVSAQQQSIYSSFAALGLQAGMQEFGDEWIGYAGLFGDFGPERGAQIRLAVKSGLFNKLVLTQLQTIILLNIGTARQRFFTGAGLSVPIVIGELEGRLPLQFVGVFGLRAPPVPSVIGIIEGGIVVPISFDAPPRIFWGFAISFPI